MSAPTDKPTRQRILEAAIRHTVGERDLEYGPPSINLACAGELKAVFDRYNEGRGGPAFIEAMYMVLTKVGRVATSPGAPKADTFEDGAAYFAIAGEVHVAPQAKEEPEIKSMLPSSFVVCTCGAWRTKGWLHRGDCPANPGFGDGHGN